MILELDLIPMPADLSLIEEDVTYLVIDSNNQPHTAVYAHETFWLDGDVPTEEEAEEAEADDAVDLVWIARLPTIPAPISI